MKNKLTNHQKKIINSVLQDIEEALIASKLSDKFVELNGAAGVGKTFSTIYIIEELKRRGYSIAFTAPTHAAISVINKIGIKLKKNMFLGTIHSFLNLKIENDYQTGGKILANGDSDLKEADVLIVDEKSMVCDKILKLIKQSMKLGNIKAVFFVGDGYQLPCVNDNVLSSFNKYHQLTEIVRQAKDNPIIEFAGVVRDAIHNKNYPKIADILSNINKNIIIFEEEKEFLKYYYNAPVNNDEKIIGAYENIVVDAYNDKIMNYLYPNNEYVEVGYSFILQETNNILNNGFWVHTQNNGQRIKIKYVQKIVPGNEYKINVNNPDGYLQFIEFQDYLNKTLKNVSNYLKQDIDNFTYYECIDNNNKKILILDENSNNRMNLLTKTLKDMAINAYNSQDRNYLFSIYFDLKNLFANVKYSHANTYHKLQGSSYQYVGIDIRNLEANQKQYKNSIDTIDNIFRLLYVGITRASNRLFILKRKEYKENTYLDF